LLKEVYQEWAAITEPSILQYLVPVLAALVGRLIPPWELRIAYPTLTQTDATEMALPKPLRALLNTAAASERLGD
jgi:hypothetical protein